MKALDGQNIVVFGEDASVDCAGEDEHPFVDADFNSEIVFDSTPMLLEEQQNVVQTVECRVDPESDIPMEICSEGTVSEKRRQETKPRRCDEAKRTQSRRRRRTLIQGMKGKR